MLRELANQFVGATLLNLRLGPRWVRANLKLIGTSRSANHRRYPGLAFHDLEIGKIKAELVAPNISAAHEILYIHGGGYIGGSIRFYREFACRVAQRLQARVISFDYRYAPEYPYPAALDDCLEMVESMAHRESSYSLLADSAGGGLCLAALFRSRELGIRMPHATVFISPWLDLTLTGESLVANQRRDKYLSLHFLRRCREHYIRRHDDRLPTVSPRFGDLRSLPPVHIHVGENEILLSDSLNVQEVAAQQGADVSVNVWKGMHHNWPILLPSSPEADAFVDVLRCTLMGKNADQQ